MSSRPTLRNLTSTPVHHNHNDHHFHTAQCSPCRSMSFVYLAAYPAMYVWRALPTSVQLRPWSIVLIPRLWTVALSCAHDNVVARVAHLAELPVPPVMAAWSILWPTIVFQSRTFSNTYEVFWVTLLAWFGGGGGQLRPLLRATTFGALTATGTFTRVTVLPYAFPFGLLLLAAAALDLAPGVRLDVAVANRPPFEVALPRMVTTVAVVTLSFVVTSAALIAEDSRHFSSPPHGNVDSVRVVVAPWNLLAFNADRDNVEQFGLHPVWTHALVNLPFLLGPLLWTVGATAIEGLGPLLCLSWKRGHPSETRQPAASARAILLRGALLGSAVLGVGALSLSPHQEPRFLLPATFGLTVVVGPHVCALSRTRWQAFVGFHLAVAGFYTLIHQAGVLPALAAKAAERDPHHHLLFYGSYMPPRFVLAEPAQSHSRLGLGSVHDLTPATNPADFHQRAEATLARVLRCGGGEGHGATPKLSLAVSASAETPDLHRHLGELGLGLGIKQCYWPHFSGVCHRPYTIPFNFLRSSVTPILPPPPPPPFSAVLSPSDYLQEFPPRSLDDLQLCVYRLSHPKNWKRHFCDRNSSAAAGGSASARAAELLVD